MRAALPGYFPGDLIDFAYDDDKTIEVTFSAGMGPAPDVARGHWAPGQLRAGRHSRVVDPRSPERHRQDRGRGRNRRTRRRGSRRPSEGLRPSTRSRRPRLGRLRLGSGCAALREARHWRWSTTRLRRLVASGGRPDPGLSVGDHSHLEAWSREAEGVRLFRFDRIVDATVLDEAAAVPNWRPVRPDTFAVRCRPCLPVARFLIAPAAAWMREYHPMRVVSELPDGSCEAVMTFAPKSGSPGWCWDSAPTCRRSNPPAADRAGTAGAALAAYAELGRPSRTATSVPIPARRRGSIERLLEVTDGRSPVPWHWLILLAVVVVLFGAKKLPDAARRSASRCGSSN